ncbi:MAG: NUDIX hydrolase [Oscillospiraceae bacterium]|nr:NUDIX hydrolase [Oscillospiraceae bacterium]
MDYVKDLRALVGHRRLILCGSSVVIRNEKGEFLLQQRVYPEGRWCFPGGLMELGESTEDTARREVFEETALTVGKLQLIGVYSGPDSLCRAANGDEWYVVNISYTTDEYSGELKINDGESAALRWFKIEEIPETLVATHKKILADYLRMTQGREA